MAWYDTNKNGGHKGTYGRPEPGYGRNAYPEHVHLPAVVQAEQVAEYMHGGGGGFNLAEHNSSPRTKDGYKHHGLGNKAHLVPWKPTHEWSESGNESSPIAHNYEKTPSYKAPHSVDNHHPYPKPQGNDLVYNNLSSGDEGNDSGSDSEKDDVVCEDGVCYRKSSGNKTKPNNYSHEDGYKKPKAKPTYRALHTVPLSTQLAKDSYYEKPSNPHYYDDTKGYTPSGPAYSNAPAFPAQDGKHTYYELEQPPKRPFSRNPPQIKTKPRDEHHKETINSSEAQKRYGGVMLHTEPIYNGTIDSMHAARKYHGIVVPWYISNNY